MDLTGLAVGDVVLLKKPHPCGGARFAVVGMGADRKIRCLTCGRYIILSPDELAKRTKRTEKENG